MDERLPGLPVSLFRGGRLALHLFYAVLLAIFYPHLHQTRRRRTLKAWSRQLLDILNIGIRTEGPWPVRGEGGYLIVANHVSWLDIFVLNAIYPARFIAKAEVRNWPLIGWLCKRSNTIFIERAMRQDAASINRHVSLLLEQGACVGLFPEGTTTDGKQAGHFHSALIQPAIDAGAMLCPIALRYQDKNGETKQRRRLHRRHDVIPIHLAHPAQPAFRCLAGVHPCAGDRRREPPGAGTRRAGSHFTRAAKCCRHAATAGTGNGFRCSPNAALGTIRLCVAPPSTAEPAAQVAISQTLHISVIARQQGSNNLHASSTNRRM